MPNKLPVTLLILCRFFVICYMLLQLQSALQHSQSGALEMQSQLQSMTEEISILRTSKVRVSVNLKCIILPDLSS